MQFKNDYRYVEFVQSENKDYRLKYFLREKANSNEAYEKFKAKELGKRDQRLLEIEQILQRQQYEPIDGFERSLTEKDFEIERKGLENKEKNFNLKEYEVLREALNAFLHTSMQSISFVDKQGISVDMLRCDNYFDVVQKYTEAKAKAKDISPVFKNSQEAIEKLKKLKGVNFRSPFSAVLSNFSEAPEF